MEADRAGWGFRADAGGGAGGGVCGDGDLGGLQERGRRGELGGGRRREPNGVPERVRMLAADPRDPGTLWAAAITRVFKSTNRGAAWFPVEVAPGRLTIPMAFAVDPVSGTIWLGCRGFQDDGGVYRGVAGGTAWSKVFHDQTVRALAVDPAAPGRLFVGSEVLGVLSGLEGIPQSVLVLRLVPDPAKPGTLYAATDRGVYVSRNRAGRWTLLRDGMTTAWVNTVAMDSRGGRGVYAGTEGGGGVFVLEGR